MSDLYKLYNQLTNRTGLFSPLSPFHSERKLAQEVGPSVVRGIADLGSSQMRSNAAIQEAFIRGQSGIKATDMSESGATKRRKMADDASALVQKLMNQGLLSRTKLEQEGGIKRVEEGGYQDRLNMDKQQRLNREILPLLEGIWGKRDSTGAVDSDSVAARLLGGDDQIETGIASPTRENKKKKFVDEYLFGNGDYGMGF